MSKYRVDVGHDWDRLQARVKELESENARLRKVVDAARNMRDAKLGRGFKKACDDFDLAFQELDGEEK